MYSLLTDKKKSSISWYEVKHSNNVLTVLGTNSRYFFGDSIYIIPFPYYSSFFLFSNFFNLFSNLGSIGFGTYRILVVWNHFFKGKRS